MRVRNLLICKDPTDEIERDLRDKYLHRVKEMFKRAVSLETSFTDSDEAFHGILTLAGNLQDFYESFMVITQYYQSARAGRGDIVARLLKRLGVAGKMEFEFKINKLPEFLGFGGTLGLSRKDDITFDIAHKLGNNLILFESKVKIDSGCTAGRREIMGKFRDLIKLLIENKNNIRNLIKRAGIENVYLVGGFLFNISGRPATLDDDKSFICFSGLKEGKEKLIDLLREKGVKFEEHDESFEKAFVIEFKIDDINISVISAYGDYAVDRLFLGNVKHDLTLFADLLRGIRYDDMWLAQILAISERSILSQCIRESDGKNYNNYIISIIKENVKSKGALLRDFKLALERRDEEKINAIVKHIISDLPEPIGVHIIKMFDDSYSVEDYICDLMQFLSCADIERELKNKLEDLKVLSKSKQMTLW